MDKITENANNLAKTLATTIATDLMMARKILASEIDVDNLIVRNVIQNLYVIDSSDKIDTEIISGIYWGTIKLSKTNLNVQIEWWPCVKYSTSSGFEYEWYGMKLPTDDELVGTEVCIYVSRRQYLSDNQIALLYNRIDYDDSSRNYIEDEIYLKEGYMAKLKLVSVYANKGDTVKSNLWVKAS